MKKRIAIVLCCMLMGISACGQNKTEQAAPDTAEDTAKAEQEQTAETDEAIVTDQAENAEEDTVTDQAENNEEDIITEEQALEAIKQYCFINNPELEEMADSDEYTIFWEVITNNAGEIVVLYRSYTGSQNRYYIDPKSGETYVTELVPGIIDEEQKTEESFNVRDYMGSGETSSAGDANADPDQIAK